MGELDELAQVVQRQRSNPAVEALAQTVAPVTYAARPTRVRSGAVAKYRKWCGK